MKLFLVCIKETKTKPQHARFGRGFIATLHKEDSTEEHSGAYTGVGSSGSAYTGVGSRN